MTRPLLTCKQLIDFLDDYVAAELSAEERGEFERHLALCPPCVSYLDHYRETIRLGRDALVCADESAPAEGVPDDLVAAILAARRR